MVRAVIDVVRRYDVDGVHIDDYFYPYAETDSAGHSIEFPDSAAYATYRKSGGKLEKTDWRRRNVDLLIHQFYDAVKDEKPWVKVGISPFGIWRPENPPQIQGLDAYEELAADARKWLREGWLDYLAPQIYWPIQPAEQSYPVLMQWWLQQNVKGRHVWPGLALYKLQATPPKQMRADEIVDEIRLSRWLADTLRASKGHVL